MLIKSKKITKSIQTSIKKKSKPLPKSLPKPLSKSLSKIQKNDELVYDDISFRDYTLLDRHIYLNPNFSIDSLFVKYFYTSHYNAHKRYVLITIGELLMQFN